MAYYGGYGSFPLQTGAASTTSYGGYPSTFGGQVGYGTSGTTSYKLPGYYGDQSYSTSSDDNNNNAQNYNFAASSLPVAGYGYSGYASYPMDPYAGYVHQQTAQAQQQQQQSFSQVPQTASYSQAQLQPAQSDELSQLAPQIEAAYEAATGQRRQPVIKRQVITVPGTPGRVQQVVRRLPTPTPDIVERVFIVKPQRDVVNLVIERPGTPPAQYKDRTVMGKQRRPLINPRIIRVAPRTPTFSPQPPQQQQQLQYQASYQAASATPQFQQFVHALPAPSPILNVQTVRVPSSSAYHQSAYQAASTQPPTAQTPQPALSSTQFAQQQAQTSQAQMSQPSQSQLLPQQMSQAQLSSSQQQQQTGKGYLIAPVQYDDAMNFNASAGYGSAITPAYGAGYSTGFAPSAQSYYGSSPYVSYGR